MFNSLSCTREGPQYFRVMGPYPQHIYGWWSLGNLSAIHMSSVVQKITIWIDIWQLTVCQKLTTLENPNQFGVSLSNKFYFVIQAQLTTDRCLVGMIHQGNYCKCSISNCNLYDVNLSLFQKLTVKNLKKNPTFEQGSREIGYQHNLNATQILKIFQYFEFIKKQDLYMDTV